MKNPKNSVTIAKGKPESRSEKEKLIYSLGSSVRGKDEFIRILKDFGIKKLVDVRRFPVSRFDYFGKDKLCSFLNKNAVEYLYLGDKLGGFRKGGYQQYINTRDFLTGLEELKSVACAGKTVFMCAERFPWRCHRRFIAQVLGKQGWRVIHIIDGGKTWEAKPKSLTQKKKSKPLSLPI